MASPDQGEDGHPTYRIPLVKPRRGPGRHYETRNVTDHGAGSPGRLITQALQATRFARAIVEEHGPRYRPADRLAGSVTAAGQYATAPAGPFRFGIDHECHEKTGQRPKGLKAARSGGDGAR